VVKLSSEIQGTLGIGIAMFIVGTVLGKIGELVSKIEEPWHTILLGLSVLALAVLITYLVFISYKSKRTGRGEQKHDMGGALLFGGFAAVMVFLLSPIYAWTTPYESIALAFGDLGLVWDGTSILIMAVGLIFVGFSVVAYLRRN